MARKKKYPCPHTKEKCERGLACLFLCAVCDKVEQAGQSKLVKRGE